MSDDAIVIDDGGSTRIKRLKNGNSVGSMNDLLDVIQDVGPPAAGRPGSHDTTQAHNRSFGERVVVTCIDSAGEAFVPPDFPVDNYQSFKVVAGVHFIDGDLVPSADLTNLRITISGERGNDPIVDAKQHNRQRRYIVSNTSAINRVAVTRAGGATVVFDASAPLQNGRTIIYTSVAAT
jgi:hypothetical protein